MSFYGFLFFPGVYDKAKKSSLSVTVWSRFMVICFVEPLSGHISPHGEPAGNKVQVWGGPLISKRVRGSWILSDLSPFQTS